MAGQKLYPPCARSLDRAVHCQTGTAKCVGGKKHETSPPQHETLLKLQANATASASFNPQDFVLVARRLPCPPGGHCLAGGMKMEPLPPPWV